MRYRLLPFRTLSLPSQASFEEHLKSATATAALRFARSAHASFGGGGSDVTNIRVTHTALVHMARQAVAEDVNERRAAWKSRLGGSTEDGRLIHTSIDSTLAVSHWAPEDGACHVGRGTSGVTNGLKLAPTVLSVPLPEIPGVQPYLRHCVSDGAHLRDIVMVREEWGVQRAYHCWQCSRAGALA